MRNGIWLLIILEIITAGAHRLSAQSVGIGTTTPATSAQLDISSTSKGLLPPRMTKVQRDAIQSPVPGLIIWCNNCTAPTGELQVFNGTIWTNMAGGTSPTGMVTICGQVWANKNLGVSHYRNGDPIPKVTDPTAWAALTTGAYCYYNNDSINYAATYGKLYNWYAVNDPRGLAPDGWHLPTNIEWFDLLNCLGDDSSAGGPLKETGIVHWNPPNGGATNSTGFTALPGGIRINGTFSSIGALGNWWTSTDLGGTAMFITLNANNGGYYWDGYEFQYGLSVRCIKD